MAAKTLISEITEGSIALGENRFSEGQLLDEAIKAGEVVEMTATGIRLVPTTVEGGYGNFLGVMKEHHEFDLDTDITAAKHGDVVTEGYCAAFVEDIDGTYYPGTLLYTDPTKAGRFSREYTTVNAVAVLKETVNNGDKVAIIKLLR